VASFVTTCKFEGFLECTMLKSTSSPYKQTPPPGSSISPGPSGPTLPSPESMKTLQSTFHSITTGNWKTPPYLVFGSWNILTCKPAGRADPLAALRLALDLPTPHPLESARTSKTDTQCKARHAASGALWRCRALRHHLGAQG
jgi:hypothetical protein